MANREENIKKINEELEKLDDEQLDQVAGGTFTANKFDERIYNQASLRTQYHFFEKDEFFAKTEKGDEVSITYNQANWAVEHWQKTGQQAPYELIAARCPR